MSTGARHTRIYAPRDEPLDDESAEQIDAMFHAAAALIRRTRPFTLDPHERRNVNDLNTLPRSLSSYFRERG